MTSVNKTTLLGRLGTDPEVINFSNGGKAIRFPLATSESWKDKKTGERRQKTQWHNIVIYASGLVGIAEKWLKKGSQVYLEGKSETRHWEKDGVKHYINEVVLHPYSATMTLLGGKPDDSKQNNASEKASNDAEAIPF